MAEMFVGAEFGFVAGVFCGSLLAAYIFTGE